MSILLLDHPDDVNSLERCPGDRAGDMDRNVLPGGQNGDHLASPELDLELRMLVPFVIMPAAVLVALFLLFMRPRHCRDRPFQPDGRQVDIGRVVAVRQLDLHHDPVAMALLAQGLGLDLDVHGDAGPRQMDREA